MLKNILLIITIVACASARQTDDVVNESQMSNTNNERTNVCNSPKCRQLADSILKRMNSQKDPCDDFYEYANGHKDSVEPFAHRKNGSQVLDEIREILEKDILENDTVKSLPIEKQLFKVCIDRGNKRSENVLRLFALIDSAGGLRSIAPKPVSEFSKTWQEADKIYSKLGFKPAFFDIVRREVRSESRSMSMMTIVPPMWRGKATQKINALYKVDWDNNLNILDEVIRANLSHSDDLKSRIPLESMEAFGIELDKIVVEVQRNAEKIQNRQINISEWQKEYDQAHTLIDSAQINWLDVMNNILSIANFDANESELLNIVEPEYFKKMANLLQCTPMDVVTSYVHLNFLSRILNMAGARDEQMNWENCLMSSDMVGAYYEYITLHKLHANREVAGRMSTEIKQYMINKAHANWPKVFELHNIDKVATVIGYPEWIHNRSLVEHYYDDFEVTDNGLQNLINMVQLARKKEIEKLRNSDMYERYPSELLFNDMDGVIFEDNKMIFSTEYLMNTQYGLFDAEYPRGINYGALGSEIGQMEYVMLENEGMKNGLTMVGNENCINDQLDTDEKTKNLDIGDKQIWLKQLQLGYGVLASYKVCVAENDVRKLPGLEELTDQQLFFIAFASNLCASGLEIKETDVHQLLNTMFSNMEEFTTAFNCSTTSRMNKQNKCFKLK